MTLPRDLRLQLDELGLETLSVRTKKHFCLRLRNRKGATGTFVLACTPSDRRAALNNLSRLKRFAHKEQIS